MMLASFKPYSNPNRNYEKFGNKLTSLEANHTNNQSLLKAANKKWRLQKNNKNA